MLYNVRQLLFPIAIKSSTPRIGEKQRGLRQSDSDASTKKFDSYQLKNEH